MSKLNKFMQQDIPNQETINAAIRGGVILCGVTTILSIVLILIGVLSGWVQGILLALGPILTYILLYISILIQFILVGLLQLFYKKIYGIFKKKKQKD
jgi:hypothetical protein